MNPLFFAAHEILAVFRIPGGKLGLKLLEAKILQHVQGEIEAAANLILNLLRSAEDVRHRPA